MRESRLLVSSRPITAALVVLSMVSGLAMAEATSSAAAGSCHQGAIRGCARARAAKAGRNYTFASPLKELYLGAVIPNRGSFTMRFKQLGGRHFLSEHGYNGARQRVMQTKYLVKDVVLRNIPLKCTEFLEQGPVESTRVLPTATLPVNRVAKVAWTPPHWTQPFPPGPAPVGGDGHPPGQLFETSTDSGPSLPGSFGGQGGVGPGRKFTALFHFQLSPDEHTICLYEGETSKTLHLPV
jgi:hypothetical protein